MKNSLDIDVVEMPNSLSNDLYVARYFFETCAGHKSTLGWLRTLNDDTLLMIIKIMENGTLPHSEFIEDAEEIPDLTPTEVNECIDMYVTAYALTCMELNKEFSLEEEFETLSTDESEEMTKNLYTLSLFEYLSRNAILTISGKGKITGDKSQTRFSRTSTQEELVKFITKEGIAEWMLDQ